MMELKAQMVPQDHKVHKDQQEHKDLKEFKAHRV